MSSSAQTSSDPFDVLALPREASEADIRARYLELVKQFPPDRDPDKFREIRAAYESTKDPLAIASRLLRMPDEKAPEWADAIKAQQRIAPRLAPDFVLSLGNRQVPPAASTHPAE